MTFDHASNKSRNPDAGSRAQIENWRIVRHFLESTPDLEVWRDRERVFWVSASVEQLLGFSVDECMRMEGFPDPLIKRDHDDRSDRRFEGNRVTDLHHARAVTISRKDGTHGQFLEMEMQIPDIDGLRGGIRRLFRPIVPTPGILDWTSARGFWDILENINEGIWVIDSNAVTTYVNKRMAEITGYTVEEMIGRHLYDFVTKEDIAALGKTIDQRRGGTRSRHEHELRRKDGTRLQTLVETYPMFDPLGTYAGSIAAFLDISTQKSTEQALRASEERFRTISESSLLGLCVLQDDRLVYANQVTAEILGYPLETILAWEQIPYDRVIYFEDRDFVVEQGRRKARGDPDVVPHYGYRMTRPNGEIRWVDQYSRTIPYGGRPANFITLIDVTERERADETIRKLSRAVEQSPVSVVITDRKGNLEYVNSSFESVTGYRRDEVLGKNPRILQSGLTPTGVYEEMWETILQGKVWKGEMLNRRKNGELFWEEAWISPLFGKDGTTTHFVGVKEEVTRRKDAEQAVLDHQLALREFVAHQEQRLERERASIAREVHDEMGQILTAIKLDAAALQSDVAPSLDILQKTLQSIFSLVEQGMKSVHTIATRLRPSVLDNLGLVPALEWLAEDTQVRTGITCTFSQPASDEAFDSGCATAVFRICQALVTNAIRHSHCRSLTMALERTTDSLILKIEDDGIGIPVEKIENPRSFGLVGIRERLMPFNGTFEIAPRHNGGTAAKVIIPIGERKEPA